VYEENGEVYDEMDVGLLANWAGLCTLHKESLCIITGPEITYAHSTTRSNQSDFILVYKNK
jgi:hypothetical protein